jgi:flagellar hook-basal body complex protein FliE
MTNIIGSPITSPSVTRSSLSIPTNETGNSSSTPNFGSLLSGALENTAGLDMTAQQQLQSHLIGGDVSSVEVFASMKKADLALRMMMQIRNKLLEGFNEIKQMQM